MIDGHRVLAVVLARGGSKGLPGKNIRPLCGRPVIAWSILAAQGSRLVDRTIVSTDDPEIAEAAKAVGGDVPYLRPAAFATDQSTVHEAIIDVIDRIDAGYDYVVALQATSPLRTSEDIDGAVEACHASGAPSCVSVVPAGKSIYWSFNIDDAGHLAPVLDSEWQTRRRQELPPVYLPNGAVYVARVDWYRRNPTFVDPATVPYVMPQERSFEIDTALDMHVIQALLAERRAAVSG